MAERVEAGEGASGERGRGSEILIFLCHKSNPFRLKDGMGANGALGFLAVSC
jgi:hypothetical protein